MSLGQVILSFANATWNDKLQFEHRGLHQTDKRVTALTGIQFYESYPMCSTYELAMSVASIRKAVSLRSDDCKNSINWKQYYNGLLVRCIRGQILNYSFRYDRIIKRRGEKWRPNALSNKFARYAINNPYDSTAIDTVLSRD